MCCADPSHRVIFDSQLRSHDREIAGEAALADAALKFLLSLISPNCPRKGSEAGLDSAWKSTGVSLMLRSSSCFACATCKRTDQPQTLTQPWDHVAIRT
jgi:transposase-like protein